MSFVSVGRKIDFEYIMWNKFWKQELYMVKIRFIQELDYVLIVCLSGVKFILMEKEKAG